MKVHGVIVTAIVWSVLRLSTAWGAPPPAVPDEFTKTSLSPPMNAEPMTWEYKVKNPLFGQPNEPQFVYKPVKITGLEKYVPTFAEASPKQPLWLIEPPYIQGETYNAYSVRFLAAATAYPQNAKDYNDRKRASNKEDWEKAAKKKAEKIRDMINREPPRWARCRAREG